MRKVIRLSLVLIFVAAIGIAVLIFLNLGGNNSGLTPIKVGGHSLSIYTAKTNNQWRQGLSGMKTLDENTGMLFLFDSPGFFEMWMKDMNFPIDIIWIDSDFEVQEFRTNISPDTYPQTFRPKSIASYALEVNAGWVQAHDIKIGDKIEFQFKI